DIAPGADIYFYAAAQTGQADFAVGIQELAKAGCDVIVDDWRFFGEPVFQDGVMAQAVDEAVTKYGAVYLSSAGNYGRYAFETTWVDSGFADDPGNFGAGDDLFAKLSTTKGKEQFLAVTMPAHSGGYFELQWSNPSASASPGKGATADVDLFIYD